MNVDMTGESKTGSEAGEREGHAEEVMSLNSGLR